MESGETLALGGLLQTQIDTTENKIPVLGDLPGVGALFRTVSHQTQETELLVLVTPVLMDPLRNSQRPHLVPGQESRSPNDAELFLGGRTEVPVVTVPSVPPPAAPVGAVILPPPPSSMPRLDPQ